jgi:glycosyltransferase involved in cell wall biosynthesis
LDASQLSVPSKGTKDAAVEVRAAPNRHIWFFLPGFESGPVGGYRVVYEYANYLVRTGRYSVTIISSQYLIAAADKRYLKLLFLRSLRSKFRALWSGRKGKPIRWFSLDQRISISFPLVRPRIEPGCDDILIATAAHTAPFVSKLANASGATGVYFLQSYETWAMPEEFVNSTWRLSLTRIAVAPWLVELGRSFGVEVALVPNSIRPDEFEKGGPLQTRKRSVIALVSNAPLKRTDLVVKIFRTLKSIDPSISMTTFGRCPRPDGLPKDTVHLRDPQRSQLAAAYRESCVYLCTSDIEGWHLPPAEALMSGTAVVSTDIGGVRAYASEAALFSPPGNADELIENVMRMLDDTDYAQALTDFGCESLHAYGPEAAAAKFQKEIERASALQAALRE